MSRLVILYEDKLGEPKPANYGPHVLALACAADALGTPGSHYQLGQRVDAIPTKGVDALLRRLPHDAALVEWLAACIDEDQCRSHTRLPPNACKATIAATIRASAVDARAPVAVVLLERNMETVYEACCAILKRPLAPKKPRPIERDSALHGLAAASEAERAALLRQVPSWARLVNVLTFWCSWTAS
jgi:hypothetical protein